jgi:List-Bact-rpt repeat protein
MGEDRLAQSGTTRFSWKAWTQIVAFAVLLLFACVLAPTRADAAVSGQQESWSPEWGEGEGELHNPLQMAANPADGSVFIGDLSMSPNNGQYRIQKFSSSGDPLGATAWLPVEPNGVTGIAINPAAEGGKGQLYVIYTSGLEFFEFGFGYVAEKVIVYSMEPAPGTKELTKITEHSLPALGSGALLSPREIVADPHTGELVAVGENELGQIALQRINAETGAFVSRYTETGTKLGGPQYENERSDASPALAIDQAGQTYVMGNEESNQPQSTTRLYTLGSEFASASLVEVPGFAAASAAEEWPSNPDFKTRIGSAWPSRFGKGSQIAVSTGAAGGDTVYFKTQNGLVEESVPGVFYLRGYSVRDEATSVVYGGGTVANQCAVQTRFASLAPGKDGTLVALDEGQNVEVEGEFPTYEPNVVRFGPNAGTACPAPAAKLELSRTSVPAGGTVTLDSSGSELNGKTLEETVWKIEGPGGSIVEKSIDAPATSITEQFATEGTYTIREKIKTSALEGIGTTLSAEPQVLQVTAGGGATEFQLAVTKTGTGTGTVTSNPAGINCGTICTAELEEGTVTLTASADAGSEFKGWKGADATAEGCDATGATLTCEVELAAAKTIEAEFALESTGTTEFPLTVTKSGTGTGTVTSNPAGINCGTTCSAEFPEGTEVELTATAAAGSKFTGWSGACTGTGACKVPVTAAATVGAAFALEATPPPAEFALTVTKIGNGTVLCNGGACAEKYPQGTELTLAAAAGSGSTFAGWSGACAGTGACKVTITGPTAVTAKFDPVTTPGNGGGGNNNGGGGANSNNPGGGGNSGGGGNTGNNGSGGSPVPGAVKMSGTTATLSVTVPGAGTVAVSGKGLVGAKVKAKGAGPVKVKLALTSAEKKQLAKKGKVTIKVTVTFTPTSGKAATATKTVTFKAAKKKK